MPIISLQRRARELGRIRMGQVVVSSNGKARPSKLDRFRITSSSKDLIEKVAQLYGGTAQPWTPQNGGPEQWEVLTDATRLPVLVPPQPVSQWFEVWSGGGCQRRCDGVTEVLSDAPCICGPDPEERMCKPTTRLNVVLSEVEGIGVFRLESHGYYAATELPSAAELLAASNGYISGHLALEERVVKRNGETRRFMVPTLDVGVTPAQLMAGNAGTEIGGSAPCELSGPAPKAIEAAPVQVDQASVSAALDAIAAKGTLDDLRAMWSDAVAAGLKERVLKIADEFKQAAKSEPEPAPSSGSPDDLWAQIMRTVPETWSTSQVEEEFAKVAGVPAEEATAEHMTTYLAHLASVTA
jgi:hypothetical protein